MEECQLSMSMTEWVCRRTRKRREAGDPVEMVSTTFGNGQRITGTMIRPRTRAPMLASLKEHERVLRMDLEGSGMRDAAAAMPAAAAEDYLAGLQGAPAVLSPRAVATAAWVDLQGFGQHERTLGVSCHCFCLIAGCAAAPRACAPCRFVRRCTLSDGRWLVGPSPM